MSFSNAHHESAGTALQRLAHALRVEGQAPAHALAVTGDDGRIWQIDAIAGADRLFVHTPVALPAVLSDGATNDCLLRINAEVNLTRGAWLARHVPSDTVRLFDAIDASDATLDRLAGHLSRLARVLGQINAAFRDIADTQSAPASTFAHVPIAAASA
ncbi:hypothetical protein [Pandoraea pnomenusa]|uniref:hypothetical protein n=1 Tax=Pandoraea pnomenusa TaxID=93220 RepID=UPI0033404E69